jgi:hypothetical protein
MDRQARPTLFPYSVLKKECGRAAAICYLQQPPLSQQAGFPQQATTVAAWAASETKRTAANANTNALAFIKISSFEMQREIHMRAITFRRTPGERG